MDEELKLPPEIYSHSLRRRAAVDATGTSFESTVERIDTTTAGHVPKRQAEQLTQRAAQDFDGFYAAQPANEVKTTDLLVNSCDSAGVTMIGRALRDATRKEAEAAKAAGGRGDPTALRKGRKHNKRMAIVTATWDQTPQPRTADDVVADLGKKAKAPKAKTRLPKPKNKRVSASVEKSQAQGIKEMFDDMDRRDPEKERTTLVLADGEERQQAAVQEEARKRGRSFTLILDLLHLLHYVWVVGVSLHGSEKENVWQVDRWVTGMLRQFLTRDPLDVIVTIRAAVRASKRELTEAQQETRDAAIDYMTKNVEYMNYSQYLAAGFPIATGVIEGACRHLVRDRLGITGARWDIPTAEAVLKLRSLRSSGDFDEYWTFHLGEENDRHYKAAA